jgi:hypothetical protein
MGGVIMKKLVSALCAAGLYFGLVAMIQAEKLDPAGLWEIIPGECYLDGFISPPHKSIDDMDGFEVPLVASWSPVELNEGTQYRGDAKFRVNNFKIGEGQLIEDYIVDIDLNRDDPGLSEEERHHLFVYNCKDCSGCCIATLATVKTAITEQIARDYETEVEDVIYESETRANFLGVFVKGMNPYGMRTGDKRVHIHIHTEVCGTYKMTLAGASTTIK